MAISLLHDLRRRSCESTARLAHQEQMRLTRIKAEAEAKKATDIIDATVAASEMAGTLLSSLQWSADNGKWDRVMTLPTGSELYEETFWKALEPTVQDLGVSYARFRKEGGYGLAIWWGDTRPIFCTL